LSKQHFVTLDKNGNHGSSLVLRGFDVGWLTHPVCRLEFVKEAPDTESFHLDTHDNGGMTAPFSSKD